LRPSNPIGGISSGFTPFVFIHFTTVTSEIVLVVGLSQWVQDWEHQVITKLSFFSLFLLKAEVSGHGSDRLMVGLRDLGGLF